MIAFLPSTYRANSADEFIGPARGWADKFAEQIAKAKERGRPPIKRLILGKPGIGKSNLAEFFCQLVNASKWSRYEFNGTSFRIDDVQDMERTVHFKNMDGEYRVFRIEEVDRMNHVAQVAMLTALDSLPPGNAVICTSNCSLAQLEPRFHRRFQVTTLESPADNEIEAMLLRHWPGIGLTNARQIATFAGGNVGQALMDCEDLV